MRASNGKEYIPPDKCYTIDELSRCKNTKNKGYFLRLFNKRLRQLFKLRVKEHTDEAR